MKLSELLLKMADGQVLDAGEKDELRQKADVIDQVDALVSGWVQPGTAVPFIRNLQAENISIPSGEITLGSGVPGDGFSGLRIAYPALVYNGENWNLVGVNGDVLQVGIRASDGKLLAAAGKLVIDSSGMTLSAQNSQSYFILWTTDDNGSLVGKIGSFYSGTDSGIEVVGRTKTGYTPVAHLMTESAASVFLSGIEVRGTGEVQIDLRTATVDTIGNQKVRVMTDVNATNSPNTVLYLESGSKGTAAIGFGTAMQFLAENASGTMKAIGYISVVYTDPVNGTEDTKVMAGYLVNGSFVEKQLAP